MTFMGCMLYLVMACGLFCWKKTVVSINLFVFSLVYLQCEVTKRVYFIGNERMLIAHDSNRLRFS